MKEEIKRFAIIRFMQKNEVLVHTAFWIIYLFFPFLKAVGKGAYPNIYNELNDLFFGIIIFYLSYLVFIFSKRKLRDGVLLLIAFCIVGYLNLKVHSLIVGGTHSEAFWYYSLSYISTYTILTLFAYVLSSIKVAYKNQVDLEEANSKKHQAELAGLKAQINPHFLFNTLNTIYSSALKKDDKTPELILKLSDNFRYMLHEGQADSVQVKQEINHLKDYVSLQQERLRERVVIDFSTDIDDSEQRIAPLLLISFIENAFKYISLLKGNNHIVKIRISLSENIFRFYCENPFMAEVKHNIDKNFKESGIGIINTKKRLEYLYPNQHILNINKSDMLFKVTLQLQL